MMLFWYSVWWWVVLKLMFNYYPVTLWQRLTEVWLYSIDDWWSINDIFLPVDWWKILFWVGGILLLLGCCSPVAVTLPVLNDVRPTHLFIQIHLLFRWSTIRWWIGYTFWRRFLITFVSVLVHSILFYAVTCHSAMGDGCSVCVAIVPRYDLVLSLLWWTPTFLPLLFWRWEQTYGISGGTLSLLLWAWNIPVIRDATLMLLMVLCRHRFPAVLLMTTFTILLNDLSAIVYLLPADLPWWRCWYILWLHWWCGTVVCSCCGVPTLSCSCSTVVTRLHCCCSVTVAVTTVTRYLPVVVGWCVPHAVTLFIVGGYTLFCWLDLFCVVLRWNGWLLLFDDCLMQLFFVVVSMPVMLFMERYRILWWCGNSIVVLPLMLPVTFV